MAEYDEIISETLRVAKSIPLKRTTGDGRIDSAIKEEPFLEELKQKLLETHPTWDIIISPPRAACDVMINSIRINLKLTDCKSSDNSVNKPSIYFSITGATDYPYSSTWNDFANKLQIAAENNTIKKTRDRETEYHYLVKNKITGDVLLKPIFDIHTYVSNPSNDLQISWKKEFEHIAEVTKDEDYQEKMLSLVECIQKSTREMIDRTKVFAYTDFTSVFKPKTE
jgi:hypothetical protein